MAGERKVTVMQSDQSLIDQEFDSIRERFEMEMKKMEEEMSRFRSQLINSERDRMIMSTAGLSTTGATSRSTSSLSSSSSSTSSRSMLQNNEQIQQHQQQNIQKQQQLQQQQLLVDEQMMNSPASCKRTATTTEQRTTTTRRTVKSSNDNNIIAQQHREDQSSKGTVEIGSGESWIDKLNSPLIQEGDEGGKVLKLRFDVTQYTPEQIVVKTVDNRLQVHAKHEEKTGNRSVYREYNREFLLPEGTNPELIKSSLSKDGVLTVEAPLPGPTLMAGARHIPLDKF